MKSRRLPSLPALRAFEAAARHLSFKEAADELFVTPAAISHQISKLEKSLQTQLFKRMNRRVVLTESGAKYLLRLRLAFDNIESATRDIVQQGDGEFITVALPPMLLNSWIIPNLSSFYKKYPNIKLQFKDTLRYLDFKTDNIDCAIRYGFGGWKSVHSEYLFSELMCPVCSPHLLGDQQLKSPEDLPYFRLIYTERRLVQWDNYLASNGYEHIKAQGQLWFLNTIHTLEATLNGLGVALINRLFVEKYLANGQLLIPFALYGQVEQAPAYYFVTQNQSPSDKVKLLYQWLGELISSNKGGNQEID